MRVSRELSENYNYICLSLQEDIKFTENLDVVSYENGKRETHNIDGRAHAAVVWDYYQVSQ